MRPWAFAASFLFAGTAAAVEVTPVLNGSLAGGQYFFKSQKGSFSGNAALTGASLLKFNERWSLLPMYSGSYQGSKGVEDGVGAGTLFQQQMDHRLSATGIRRLEGTNWRLKPSASYKREFLKETRDETWGKGLFDYEKAAVGFEAENVYRDPFTCRFALDAYRVRFPNYESLESKSGVDPLGNPLGRELASKRVLDTYNYQFSASGSRPLPYDDPRFVIQGAYSFLYQRFLDQRLVDQRGQFENSGRRDILQSLSGSVGRPLRIRIFGEDARLDLSLGVNLAYNRSNQNTYDAVFSRYVPDAYSYVMAGAGPAANLSWGGAKQPSWLSGSFRWSRQNFIGRLAQDGSGVYGAAKQRQDRYILALGYGHPIAPSLTLTVRTNLLWADSNQKYEKTYSYTYRTINYLLGVSYEY